MAMNSYFSSKTEKRLSCLPYRLNLPGGDSLDGYECIFFSLM